MAKNTSGLPTSPSIVQADPLFFDIVHSDYRLRVQTDGVTLVASPAVDFAPATTGNDHFDIERSRDGVAYTKIGEVKGFGTSSAAHDYAFTDAGAAPVGGGQVYYRLRQVDADGRSEFSPVRTLEFGVGAAGPVGFLLVPNPAQQRVSLQLSLVSAGTVCLTDLAGRVVLRQAIEAGALRPSLDLAALPTGIYVVQVEQNGQRFSQRLVHTGN